MKVKNITISPLKLLFVLAAIFLVVVLLVFRNKQYTYYLTIRPLVNPTETRVTANNQRLFLYSSDNVSSTYVYYGNETKLNISISNPAYKDVSKQLVVKNKQTETLQLEKKSPGEMSLEDFITIPPGQKVIWKEFFGNQTWALVGTNSPNATTTDTVYVLLFDTTDYEWRVVVSGRGITSDNTKLQRAPVDLVKYLEGLYATS